MERATKAGSILFVSGLAALALAFTPAAGATPQFYDGPDGWAFRTELNVTSTAGNFSDFQVPFTLNTGALVAAGRMRSDCGDLRVADENGAFIPHWIESGCNTTTTRVWTKAPSLISNQTRRYSVFHGAPSATSTSDVNQTFIVNEIRVEGASCGIIVNNCPMTSHAQADALRGFTAAGCVAAVLIVSYGEGCTTTLPGTNTRDLFTNEYRFLFVPDVTGSWTWRIRADNYSEFATSPTDSTLVTSNTAIAPDYTDNGNSGTERLAVVSLTAGVGQWYSFVTSDTTGAEFSRLRLTRPAGGPIYTFGTPNFGNMIFSREYANPMPSVQVGATYALPTVPTGLTTTAGPGANEVTVNWTPPSSSGSGPLTGYRFEGAPTSTGTWSLLANVSSTSQTVTGFADGQTWWFRVTAHNARGLGPTTAPVSGTAFDTPTAPNGFAATAQNHSVLLTWSAPSSNGGSPVTGWNIYVGPAGGARSLHAATSNGANTSFLVNGLTNGANYDFDVRAVNIAGEGDVPSKKTASPGAIPDPPANLQWQRWGSGSIRLTWSHGATHGHPLDDHRIYTNNGGLPVFLAQTGSGTNVSFVVNGLTNGETTRFFVTAHNAKGWSNGSAEVFATPMVEPSAPLNLVASPGVRQISLSWNAPASDGGSPVTNYLIKRGGVNLTQIGTNRTYVDMTLANNQTAQYTVTAVNAIGPGPVSNTASTTTHSTPSEPTSFTATGGVRKVTLAWDAPNYVGGTPVTNHKIYRDAVLLATIGTNLTFTDATLGNGVTHTYTVRAVNAAGDGAISGGKVATTYDLPGAPESFFATRGDRLVTLTWSAGTDGGTPLTGYDIYAGTTSGATSLLASTTDGGNTSFVVNGLTNGTTYFFNVTARNAAGSGASTVEASAKPAGLPSGATITGGTPGNRTASISWLAGSGNGEPILHYHVYRAVLPSNDPVLVEVTTNLTHTSTGLANGTTYMFFVRPVNVVGEGSNANTVSLTPFSIPDPPILTSATRGNRSIHVGWMAPLHTGGYPISGYQVHFCVSTNCGPTNSLAFVQNPGYTIVGLTNGTTYDVWVKAQTAVGLSGNSAVASATPASVPDAPLYTMHASGNSSVSLAWNPAVSNGEPILDYTITRDGQFLVTLPNRSFVDETAENGVVYVYGVSARNVLGSSPARETPPLEPLAPPFPPTITSVTASNRTLQIAWDMPTDTGGRPLLGTTLYLCALPCAEEVTTTATSPYTWPGLSNGTEYRVRAKALTNVGYSGSSNEMFGTPLSLPDPPADLVATNALGEVLLTWNAPAFDGGSPITNYQLYRDDVPLALIGENTSYLDTNAPPATLVTYAVASVTNVGEGNAATTSGTNYALPGAPTGLSATGGVRQAGLTWSPPGEDGGSPLTGYVIRRGGNVLATIGTNTSFIDATLSNGETASYTVSAKTVAGEGPESASDDATAFSLPEAPVGLAHTRGVRNVSLSWSPPADDGGSPVTLYRVYRDGFFHAEVGLDTHFLDAPLADGEDHAYAVTASTAAGEGPQSEAVESGSFSLPESPETLAGARGVRQVALTWDPPAWDGGTPITGYRIYRGESLLAALGTNTSFVDATLANGETHTYSVTALNAAGEGGFSPPLTIGAYGLPGAPVLPGATASVRQIELVWQAPASDGGTPLTAYRIYRDGALLATIDTNTTFVDTMLSNGQTATYRVSALNAAGEGAQSVPVSATTPTVPTAPLGLVATPGVRSISLSWSPPGSNGGEPVTAYVIHRGGVAIAEIGANTSFVDATRGNDETATYAIAARNAAGLGPVGPAATATTFRLPGAPLALSAAPGVREITLSWSAPTSNGGAPIEHYTIYRGGSFLAQSGANTTFTDATLGNGETRTYTVAARTAVGEGAPSGPASATTWVPPGRPILTATRGDASALLSWAAPASNGGTPITGYDILLGTSPSDLPLFAQTGANTTFTANGLMNGQLYHVKVVARNAVGPGLPSDPQTVTPARVPDAPAALAAIAQDARVSLSWNAPPFDGGAAVTNYEIHVRPPGGSLQLHGTIGTNRSYVVHGLTNGASYGFAVRAINNVGLGALTPVANATPGSVPVAPTLTSVSTTAHDIHLNWTLGADGGRPLQNVFVYASATPGAERWLVATLPAGATTFIDDVPPATARSYVVTARNSLGESAPSNEMSGASLPDPLTPTPPETYRSCSRDIVTGVASCTPGSSRDVVGLAAGSRHTCVILETGQVDCWGDNSAGQSADHLSGPVAVQVSAGSAHTCVRLADKNVDCYGNNAFGRANSYTGGDAERVSAGNSHTCFLLTSGTATCQGANAYGQSTGRASGVLALAAGGFHTCYVLSDRSVSCDGLNDRGQATPPALTDADRIVAGAFHTCALSLLNEITCWGDIAGTPTGVLATDIAAGRLHSCAITTVGQVVCWGSDRDGQSAGYTGFDAIAVAAGESHTCVLRGDTDDVVCWGSNPATDHGQGQDYPHVLEPSSPGSPAAMPSSPSEGAILAPIEIIRRPDP